MIYAGVNPLVLLNVILVTRALALQKNKYNRQNCHVRSNMIYNKNSGIKTSIQKSVRQNIILTPKDIPMRVLLWTQFFSLWWKLEEKYAPECIFGI